MRNNKQSGFTLIELIAVIVILGILAAIAIPRYADLSSSARQSAIKGLAGAFQGASALAHSLALANGTASAASSTVTMEGAAGNVATVFGYPAGTAGGIATAANISSDFTCTYAAGVATCQMATNGLATCQVVYTAATSATVPATVVTTVTTC